MYMYIYIYIYVYMYVCMYVCIHIYIYRERERCTYIFSAGPEASEHAGRRRLWLLHYLITLFTLF